MEWTSKQQNQLSTFKGLIDVPILIFLTLSSWIFRWNLTLFDKTLSFTQYEYENNEYHRNPNMISKTKKNMRVNIEKTTRVRIDARAVLQVPRK